MCLAFIAGVTAVTDTTNIDPASLSLSLFKKKNTTSITGNTIDDFGNTIATVTIKAGEEVGRVRDDFYGVNTHGLYLGPGTKIDADEDGVVESASDLEWHRKVFLDSGMKYIRWDANLQNYYFYNETTGSYYFKGNLSNRIEQLKWAHENGIRLLLIMDYMPDWLADSSIDGCNINNLKFCSPYDYNLWGNITVDYLGRLTENEKYIDDIDVEVWNEPDLDDFWLTNLNEDQEGSMKRAIYYNLIYNATYDALKSKYSNIAIGGPTFTSGDIRGYEMLKGFLANNSNKINFISFHPYDTNKNNNLRQYYDISKLLANCSYYNITCTNIILSEWNVGNSALRNQSTLKHQYGNSISQSYISILNNYPSIVSMIFYQWSETKKYSPNTNYSEYPQRWSMVSEAGLDNPYPTYYPSYNVTKDFAHYHAGGNMIVNSSSNNNSIKSVASLNPQGIWHITVINTGTNNINVSIDVSSTGVEAVKDLATGIIYPVSENIVNVGVLTEYDVKHYEGIANYEPPAAITSNEKESSSGGGSSSPNNKAVSANELLLGTHEVISVKSNTSVIIPTNEILINPETITTTSESQEEEEFYGPIRSEEERLSQEGYESELGGNSYNGALSLAISNKSYLTIAIILLGSIICTVLIISIIYRKKKREADKVKKLMDWVDKARALGYTPEKMKEMLAQYNWDKELVEKVVGI